MRVAMKHLILIGDLDRFRNAEEDVKVVPDCVSLVILLRKNETARREFPDVQRTKPLRA